MGKRKVIVKYKGGLGNQMFQYMMAETFKNRDYEVLGDISWYKQQTVKRKFLIDELFSNVIIEYVDEKTVQEYEKRFNERSYICKIYQYFFVNNKPYYREKQPYIFDKKLFGVENTIIDGYWQSYKYFEDIRENALRSFVFPSVMDKQLIELKNRILGCNIASLHVRGSDYRKSENKEIFGEGCNREYYLKAIDLIKKKNPDVQFWGFTDDLEYAKEIVALDEIRWMDIRQIGKYEDWMDMYFMSLCKYNILANSSFSWWGAYLNRNIDKFIIAPKEWQNKRLKDDICPKEWIRI